tara:strand:- start:991 stop:1467 length:477 start_codon:yes stop_codon:yes gene_type:complete
MQFYLVSNFGTIVRILSGIGLSVFFGIFAFFVVQSIYVLSGGSWGYWPKSIVIISWFYLPGLFASLGSFLPIWIYSEYSIMYKALAIIIVIIFVILVSYFTFNLTLNKYEGLDYWLRYGMIKDMANTIVWMAIISSNIVSLFLLGVIFLYQNNFKKSY